MSYPDMKCPSCGATAVETLRTSNPNWKEVLQCQYCKYWDTKFDLENPGPWASNTER